MDETKQLNILAIIAIALIGILSLFQGGYYSDSACVAGLIAVIACVGIVFAFKAIRKEMRIPLYAIFLIGIGSCTFISATMNTPTASSIAEASVWFSVAAVALLCLLIPNTARPFMYRILGWVGVASAILALLMCANIVPYAGSMNAGRLQYSFQYANTAGLWFVVMFVVAILSDDKRLRIAAFFPMLALFLTQSIGTLVLFVLVALVILIMWYRQRYAGRICALFMQLVCAVAAAAVAILVGVSTFPWIVLVVAAGGFLLLLGLRRFIGRPIESWLNDHMRALFLIIVLLVVSMSALLVVFFLTGRLAQASQTFIERLVQMGDALFLLGSTPLFGIGPDGWMSAYPAIQSAQYVAASVHNGYLQIALDTGLIGLAFFVAFLAMGFYAAIKERDVASIIAAGLICVHSFFDFDLSFAAILMLLVLLFPKSPRLISNQLVNRVVFGVISLLVAAGCIVGVWAWQQKGEVLTALNEGDLALAGQKMEENVLLGSDKELQTLYLRFLCQAREWGEAAIFYDNLSEPNAEQAMTIANVFYALGEQRMAEDVLLTQMEAEPRNAELFRAAAAYFDEYGLSEEAQERYKNARDVANAPAEGIGSLLQNQERL